MAHPTSLGLTAFLSDVTKELDEADRRNAPQFASIHEAFAVIAEEVDELWDLCRLKGEHRDPAHVRTELVQIAAMAAKAARSLGLLGGPARRQQPDEAVASATTPVVTGIGVNDPVAIKIHVESCLTSLLDKEDSRCKFELATAATKLREAVMWIDEHLRLH